MTVRSGPEPLVVLVAPAPVNAGAGLLAGVRDALQDWSALGLVRPFVWVQDPTAAGPQDAVEIIAGRAHPVRLTAVLAGRDHARVRLAVLVPAFAGAAVVAPDVEDQLVRLVRSSTGAVPVDALRCVVTRPGSGPGPAPVAREAWHNLVISPEDSRGPGLGHHLLEPTDDPAEIGPHAAAAVCGLLGLWSGVPDAPLDDRRLPPARVARVVRSFVRKLDADRTSAFVRDGVFSMSGDLPRPRVGNGRAVTVDDTALANQTMSDQLWAKHHDVLQGPRESRPATEVSPIGVVEALQMLFTFLVATIKNAPLAWYAKVVQGLSTGVANRVHATVFGQTPSAYQVVFNGRRPDGLPADWQDLSAASSAISEAIESGGARATHAAHADLSRVWRDYVQAAFTLADAGERSAQLPAIAVGVDRGVLARAVDCAPGPSTDFTAIPEVLQPTAGTSRLTAADALGQQAARARLSEVRSDGSDGLDADRTLRELDRWTETHRHSFVARSGTRLAAAVTTLTAEVKDLLARLQAAGEAARPSDALLLRQRRLARLMRGLMIGFAVIEVVLVVLGATDVLEWSTVALIGVIVLVLWLVGSFATFLRAQRNLFAELHRRREAESQAQVNQVNLGHALADLRRTTSAYGQHLAWSRVLGAVLARPFGEPVAGGQAAVLAEDALPLAMRIGSAEPEPTVVANTNAQLRRVLYRDGWLTAPWEQIIAEAPSRLGPDGIDLADDPGRIYAERAGAGTVLDRWVQSLETDGTGTASGDLVWQQVLAGIAGTDHAEALLQRVGVGALGAQTRAAFMSGVDADDAGARADIFDGQVFTASARAQQRNQVVETWRRTAATGLSRIAVTVQLSEALPGYELDGLEGAEEAVPSATGSGPAGYQEF